MGGFSRFFIYRPVFALVISIVIVLVGLISIPILPVESTPDITPPTVAVTTKYPGASADVLAQTVAQPIEQEVNGVEDMLYMSSKSAASGDYTLTVYFEVGTDVDMATVLTQNRVAVAEPMLPEEVKRQGVKTQKKSTKMVLAVTLSSPDGRYDDMFLSNYATTQIKDVLARVNGVGLVNVMGAKDFGMRVWLDPTLLKARGLTTNDIIAALREQNIQVAAGKIGEPPTADKTSFQYTVTTLGRLNDPEQFQNIIVKRGERGQVVRLSDVSRVELGSQTYAWYAQLNSNPTSMLAIYQIPGSNALAVKDGILESMEELARNFPEGLEWSIPYDSTAYISASIDEVVETLVIAIILVIFTVWIFLQDWRTTLVPSVTIPVSLIGTFAVMLVTGQSINNLTLFGLILAIGIVVDDAIVVVENTMRIIDTEGLGPKEAVSKAMGEVGGAIVATTLVLLAVFAPCLVLPGLTGRMYRPFAITISVATVFSSINALTLSPALCGLLLRPSEKKRRGFFKWFNDTFDKTTNGYMGIVETLTRRAVLGAVVVLILLGAAGFGLTRLPGGFVPSEDEGYFFVNAQLPASASLERTTEVMKQVDEILLDTPGVADTLTVGGYTLLDAIQGSNYGLSIACLENWADREHTVFETIQMVQARLSQIQEGVVFAFGPPPIAGLGAAGGFQMELQDRGGAGLTLLERVANDVAAAGTASPMLTRLNQNLRAGVPQLYADVDREKAKRMNVPLQWVFDTLQANLGSAYVNDFNLFGRTWRVLVQADQPFRMRPEDIDRLEVRSADGNMVPLSTLVTVSSNVGPETVNRFNMFPSATITGSPTPGFSEGQAVNEIERITQEVTPPSIGYEWSGVTQQQKAAGNLAPVIFGLAIVFVFLFLSAQYESWTTPLSVLLSVPLAILGAVVITMARSLDNNIYFQIGMILLIGLSAKSAILIVEFAKQQHEEEGKSIFEATMIAARLRFRAILMTAFSFILGVIPLVIASGAGANSRVSLGSAVFGGMLVATVAGVFVIPLLYFVVTTLTEKFAGNKAAKPDPVPAGTDS
jgi:HAE1 family hydrophobic/amphiphilic exporter-1